MRLIRIFSGALVVAAMSVLVFAGQQATQSGAAGQPPAGDQMATAGMMKQCQEHHQAMRAALETALATTRDARQSNDAARMRAALEQVETSLAGMQQRMSTCTTMMSNMSNMMGMRGRGMGPQPETTPER